MSSYDLSHEEEFLELIGFRTQANILSTKLHIEPQTQTYEKENGGVYGGVGNNRDDSEREETNEDAYESICNDDLYNEEMYELRVANRNLRCT